MVFTMYKTQCYPFGEEYSILIGDARAQYIHFYRMLFDRLAENKSFLFSWDTGMGFDFFDLFLVLFVESV